MKADHEFVMIRKPLCKKRWDILGWLVGDGCQCRIQPREVVISDRARIDPARFINDIPIDFVSKETAEHTFPTVPLAPREDSLLSCFHITGRIKHKGNLGAI